MPLCEKDIIFTLFIGFIWWLNEAIHIMSLAKCLAHDKHIVSIFLSSFTSPHPPFFPFYFPSDLHLLFDIFQVSMIVSILEGLGQGFCHWGPLRFILVSEIVVLYSWDKEIKAEAILRTWVRVTICQVRGSEFKSFLFYWPQSMR